MTDIMRIELPDFDLEHRLKLWKNVTTKTRGSQRNGLPRFAVNRFPGQVWSNPCIFDMVQETEDMVAYREKTGYRTPPYLVPIGEGKRVKLHPITFTLWIFSQITTEQANFLGARDTIKNRSPRHWEGYLDRFTEPSCPCADPSSEHSDGRLEYHPDGTLKPPRSPCINPNHWLITIAGKSARTQIQFHDEYILNPVESPFL
jgi:hypothetical protein